MPSFLNWKKNPDDDDEEKASEFCSCARSSVKSSDSWNWNWNNSVRKVVMDRMENVFVASFATFVMVCRMVVTKILTTNIYCYSVYSKKKGFSQLFSPIVVCACECVMDELPYLIYL